MNFSLRHSSLVAGLFAATLLADPAAAARHTITFEEPGITAGTDDGGNGNGESITNQYAPLATFSWLTPDPADPTAPVGSVEDDTRFDFLAEGEQVLFVQTQTNPTMVIELGETTDFLSFDFRRSQSARDIFVKLYDGANLIFDPDAAIGWDPVTTPGFATFSYLGDFGAIDRIELTSDRRFIIDNLSFDVQAVPLPAPVMLLGSALLGLFGARRTRPQPTTLP